MFPRDIAMIIASYDEWVIAPWVTAAIPISAVHLASNPMALDIIMRRKEWYHEHHRWMLARNCAVWGVLPILSMGYDEIYASPAAIDVIRAWPPTTKRGWAHLCENPAAMDMIAAMPPELRSGHHLCKNPAAMDMIRAAGPGWVRYSVCANPAAMDMIAAMPPASRDWYHLCMNPAALGMVRADPKKIEPSIYMNPAIFIIDAARAAEITA
jgi:hypothetical protein